MELDCAFNTKEETAARQSLGPFKVTEAQVQHPTLSPRRTRSGAVLCPNSPKEMADMEHSMFSPRRTRNGVFYWRISVPYLGMNLSNVTQYLQTVIFLWSTNVKFHCDGVKKDTAVPDISLQSQDMLAVPHMLTGVPDIIWLSQKMLPIRICFNL